MSSGYKWFLVRGAAVALLAVAGAAPARAGDPRPLPPSVAEAWEAAGARVSWTGTGSDGRPESRSTPDGLADPVPLIECRSGDFGRLPAPPVPFALDLRRVDLSEGGHQELNLRRSVLTDAAIEYLAGLRELRELRLDGMGLTDAGLKHLAGLKQLQRLDVGGSRRGVDLTGSNLFGTKITDAGLRHLAGLKQLRELALSYSGVAGAGLKELSGFEELRELRLTDTKVTDAGPRELVALKRLRVLDLRGTEVADDGLKHLAGLRNLRKLELGRTRVPDDGLKELAGLKGLQRLDLSGTRVTDEGVGGLRRTLPGCLILR